MVARLQVSHWAKATMFKWNNSTPTFSYLSFLGFLLLRIVSHASAYTHVHVSRSLSQVLWTGISRYTWQWLRLEHVYALYSYMYRRPYALTVNEQSAISARFWISCFYILTAHTRLTQLISATFHRVPDYTSMYMILLHLGWIVPVFALPKNIQTLAQLKLPWREFSLVHS